MSRVERVDMELGKRRNKLLLLALRLLWQVFDMLEGSVECLLWNIIVLSPGES